MIGTRPIGTRSICDGAPATSLVENYHIEGRATVSLGSLVVDTFGTTGILGVVLLGALDVVVDGQVERIDDAQVALGGLEITGDGRVDRFRTADVPLGALTVFASGDGEVVSLEGRGTDFLTEADLNAYLDMIVRNVSVPSVGPLYAALFSSTFELPVTRQPVSFAAPVNGVCVTDVDLLWEGAVLTDAVRFIGLMDQMVGGNVVAVIRLVSAQPSGIRDVFFPAGSVEARLR